ncbi:tape measure protein [Oenococcus oeni]|uniref:tape measure protein n=1 Tax=Oenococcus oeni TaxID=1247 RepID=UPI0010AF93B2|nr:tape measure protein [Oenococcus oeni]SYW16194.1 putative Phage tail tape-measure protein [Oenococcus oeni]
MSDSKVSGEMGTKYTIDGSQAIETLKTLKSAVSETTSSWRSHEAVLKSSGDTVAAAKTKYEGLSDAVSKQQAVLDRLKSEQSKVNTETNEGQQQYSSYQKQVDGATTKLISLTTQQTKAKDAFELQNSGILKLNDSIKQSVSVTNSYVERLKAEGNESEATKTKINGLKDQQSLLSDLYTKQKEELDKLKSAEGDNSEAIAKQTVRVNETAKSMAEAKTQAKDLQSQTDKSSSGGFFTSLKDKVLGVKSAEDKTSKSTSSLGDIIKGSFIGTTITNAVQNLAGNIKNVATESLELVESAEKNEAVWKTLGVNDAGIKSLTSEMKSLRAATGLSEDDVTSLQKKFYSLTGSVSSAETLTKGVATLGASLRLTSTQTSTLGSTLDKVAQSGTMTSTNLARMEKQAPGIGAALAKAAGVSTTAFSTMVSSGKVNSASLEDLLGKISKNSSSTFSSFGKTSEGAMDKLKGSWQNAEAAMAKPLVSVQSTGLSAITKVLSSNATQKLFQGLGTAIAGTATKFASFINYIGSHQKDISTVVTSIGGIAKAFAVGIWDTAKDMITGIAKAFNDITGNSKKAKDPLGDISTALKTISSHKNAIEAVGSAIVGAFVAVKITSGITAMISGISGMIGAFKAWKTATEGMTVAQKALNLVMKGNVLGIIVTAIAAVVVALVELYKHDAKFRAFVNGIIKACEDLYKETIKWFQDMWKDITSGLNSFEKNFSKVWNDIGSFFKAIWKDLEKTSSTAWNWISDTFESVLNGIYKFFKSIWNDVVDFFKTIWKNLEKIGSDGWNWISDKISPVLKTISGAWKDMWGGVRDFFGDIWKDIKKDAKTGINDVIGIINDGIGGIDDVIHDFGGSKTAIKKIPKFANGTQNGAPAGLAMVNDGKGKEAIIDNSGDMHVLSGKNRLVNFSGGETVVPYEATRLILGDSVSHFASGTDGWLSSIGSWFKDKWTELTDIIAHPVQDLEKIMTKAVNSAVGGASDIVDDLSSSLGEGLAQGLSDPLTKLLKSLKSSHDSSESNPSGSGVTRWEPIIKEAAKKMDVNLTAAGMTAVLKRINQESGGSATVVNDWDSNAAKGIPSKGLLQYIQSTLDYWEPKGVTPNLLNGYDQLLALFNDSNWLADISVSGGWGPTGMKKFAYGGLSNVPAIFGDDGPEMAIPLGIDKHSRAVELLNKTNRIVNSDSVNSMSAASTIDTSNLEILMTKLVQVSTNQLTETQKSNQTVDNITANKFSRAIVSRAVKGLA